MRRLMLLVTVAAAVALVLPAISLGHPERTTEFPNPAEGERPTLRKSGPVRVVCKADSAARIRRQFGVRRTQRRGIAFTGKRGRSSQAERLRRQGKARLRLIAQCRYRHIQAAVNAAQNGDRILILPGVYKEEPSRRVQFTGPEEDRRAPSDGGDDDPGGGLDAPNLGALAAGFLGGSAGAKVRQAQGTNCNSTAGFEKPDDGDAPVPTYRFQLDCPNSRNLVAILGDSDDDGRCDRKCDLQLQGMGRKPTDVLVVGDRVKRDVIRGDRADGLVIRNLAVEQAAFNGIDILETNGFIVRDIVARYNQNYGILTFTTDHGLYERIDAHHNGDGGVYPGSGPEGHCGRYGIEIRNVDSHHNVLGYSGTAGNGVYAHDNKFRDNSVGMVTDSFASGHPGMPQDCAKWENNQIYSNNVNYFTAELQRKCGDSRYEDRPRTMTCPQFQVPVGTGIGMYGANENLVKGNHIYDNWRAGTMLFYVPAAVRGETDPAKQTDTSNGNRQDGNKMGVRPDGTADANGIDFRWDNQGAGNCWTGNTAAPGRTIKSDPPTLPDCPGSPVQLPPNPVTLGGEAPCATWDEGNNQRPPGCTWFDTPPEPN